ncbi:histidine phosphatase family protein [Granulosicoccaceae sp. 1_MG-2023]|nr:histidine phosphatase family protein [Granulosicoccaceae sp. 1_MG-2023]
MSVVVRKARWLLLALLVGASLFRVSLFAATRSADASLWQGIAQGDYVVLMRHAQAPGIGDPADFQLGDCSTQRNLSERGQAQAVAIGELMRLQGVREPQVLSSQWCRCLDTAEALGYGPATAEPSLNSVFQRSEKVAQQNPALESLIREADKAGKPTILLTHQVNISALTGIFPASGEMLVMDVDDEGALVVKGRINPA